MSSDMLKDMFRQQTTIMEMLRDNPNIDFPDWPLDLSKKESQRICKNLAFEAMGELFEAVQHLKNSKGHRITDMPEVDRAAMIEELTDAMHYFLEILILTGIDPEEFYRAYVNKGIVVMNRIKEGY